MVDNIDVTPGTGKTVATDEVGGIQYQLIKVAVGADGVATWVTASDPFPVAVISGAVTVSGTAAATQSGTWTVQPGNTANTTPWLVDNSAAWSKNAGTADATTLRVTIDNGQVEPIVAHGAADSGSPIKMGFKASTLLSGLTLVDNADRTDAYAGVDGVQIIRPHCNLEDIVTTTTLVSNTDGTSTQVLAAGAAGIKHYLTSITLVNTSATAIYVEIKDGSTTKIVLPVPATSGCVFNPPVPIPGTAATAWNFDGSAAATTLYCSVIGFKSKV